MTAKTMQHRGLYSGLVLAISIALLPNVAIACNIDTLSNATVEKMRQALSSGGLPVFDSSGKLKAVNTPNGVIGCAAKAQPTAKKDISTKCVFDFYQYRSPFFHGCSITVNQDGLMETFTYSKKGQFGQREVFHGNPNYAPLPKGVKTFTENGCPKAAIAAIGNTLGVGSWETMRTMTEQLYTETTQAATSVATITLGKDGSSIDGTIDLLGASFKTNFKNSVARDGSLVGETGTGITVQFRNAKASTMSAAGDFGSMDFKGGCTS